ncbi:hypothetical protein [Gandjariella thermophila]|uniref:PPE family domain-containing protein n=1 Tax=Gandjariella thermophila TaxID=1931992 RepID=A0A4D4JFC5_9PSEU|nr:hypothetical protein [Gandjariella thermophila]GDY33096.1 hypothetical protein GTS_47290 [Gandjariella thermophila]
MGFEDAYRSVVGTIDRGLNRAGHWAGSAIGHGYSFVTGDRAGGQAVERAIDRASDVVFFDGKVAGLDPWQIYDWYHGKNARGTGDYGHAEADLRALADKYRQYEDHARRAQAALQEGWTGPAAESAKQSVAPLAATFAGLQQHAVTRQSAYGAQMPPWEHTKNSVVEVPKQPPQANPLLLNPAVPAGVVSTIDTDRQIVTYQQNAQQNQQAFTAYQPPTQQNAASIPQQANPVDPGQSNTGVTPPPTGGGVPTPRPVSWQPGAGGTGRTSSGRNTYSGGAGGGAPLPGTAGYGGPGDSTSAAGYLPPTQAPAATGFGPGGGAPAGGGDVGPGAGFGPGFGPVGGFGGPVGGDAGSDGFSGRGGRLPGAGGGRLGGGAGSGAGGTRGPGNAAGLAAEEEGVLGRGGAAGAAGRAGAAGPAGMGAGGRGGRGEEDKEHRAASYLSSEDNGNEIVGDLPLTAPPVIGE